MIYRTNLMFVLLFGFVLAIVFSQTVYAIEQGAATQVTIQVPSDTVEIDSLGHYNAEIHLRRELFPVLVEETRDERGRNIVIKKYELSRAERPEDIPRDSIVFGGITYAFTSITRERLNQIETRNITEEVEKSSHTNNIDQVLGLLEPQIYFDDGHYTGILNLDISSIRVEEAGRTTTSRTATITREFPSIPRRDVSLLPREISQGGVTYSLTDVNWVVGNSVTVNYTQIGEYFTAIATYSGRVSSTSVTGFTVTANYMGYVSHTNTELTIYTVIFIEEPQEIIQYSAYDLMNMIIGFQHQVPTTSYTTIHSCSSSDLLGADIVQEQPMPTVREVTMDEMLEILGASDVQEVTEDYSKNKRKWIFPGILAGILLVGGGIVLYTFKGKWLKGWTVG